MMKKKIFVTKGPTKITIDENYILNGKDLLINKKKNLIISENKTTIIDSDQNKITLNNFKYNSKIGFFKSLGEIEIKDKNENIYEFTQLYIDTKKKEIIGTDIKAFLNDSRLKVNENNDPRVFGYSLNLKKDKSTFYKNIFTLCGFRKNDKCPPWSIQSKKMLHDNKKKTVYFDNALLKIYDIPIFYFPKISFPDPTVERRSGFLLPTYSDTKNLGSSVTIPYFFAINDDKNLTISNRLFASQNPLINGEYHQVFRNSYLMTDFGYTEGYKKTTNKKKSGSRSHFFSYFTKDFVIDEDSKSSLSLSLQNVSNDKYLKTYKIKSNLVNYEQDTLTSSLNFTHEDEDLFLESMLVCMKHLKVAIMINLNMFFLN